MKAIQHIAILESLTEADKLFSDLCQQENFLGGRLTQGCFDGLVVYKLQVFFSCDENLEYGEISEDFRVVFIPPTQKLSVGVGNPYYQVNLQCPIEQKPTEPNKPTYYCFNSKDELVIALESDTAKEVIELVQNRNSDADTPSWQQVTKITDNRVIANATAVYHIKETTIKQRTPAFYDYDKEKAKEMRRYNKIADGLEQCDKQRKKQELRAKRKLLANKLDKRVS